MGHKCAEVSLSQDASQLILVDGATGERHHPVDAVLTPTEVLAPREVAE
jgi:hypothetical protein